MPYRNDFICVIRFNVWECSSAWAVYLNHHDDVIKWIYFPRYWPFVRRIHRSPVNSPHKGQWRGALMCSLVCVWINGWVNNGEAGDLRRHRPHYDAFLMIAENHCIIELLASLWIPESFPADVIHCARLILFHPSPSKLRICWYVTVYKVKKNVSYHIGKYVITFL